MNAVTCPQLENVTSKQVSNILRVEKENNLGKECYCLIKHFQEKTYLDSTQYFAVDLDPERYLRNVF
mgnify:CR=1 FL=1